MPGASALGKRTPGYRPDDLRYAAQDFPSSLTTGTKLAGRFRADRSSYNVTAANLKRTRAAAAAAYAGAGRLDICCLGTSITGGTGGGTKVSSWPSMLQKMLVAKGYPDGGSGFIAAQSNITPSTDPRVTATGWAAQQSNRSPAMKGTSTTPITFTDTKPSTIIDVWYLDYFTFGASWTIDGVAQTDIPMGNTLALLKVTVSGLTSAAHTVVITPKTGVDGTHPVYIMGVSFRNTTGIAVHNLGVGGIVTSSLSTATAQDVQKVAQLIAPQLTFVESGANDGVPLPVGYPTQMQSIITGMAGVGSDVALMAEPPAGGTSRPNATGKQVYSPLYTVADTNSLPLIDMYDRMVSWTSLDALGLGFDTDALQVHLSPAGYAEMARTAVEALGI